MLCFSFTLLLVVLSVESSPVSWGYEEGLVPSQWGTSFPDCNGQNQSPIDLKEDSITYKSSLGQFQFTGYSTPLTLPIKNNGHTVQADVSNNVRISGGGLTGSYKLLQFHFHWGSDDSKGSEHTVDGDAKPMELHLVHYKDAYGSVGDALQKSDGLAVLCFFFEISNSPNQNFQKIIDTLAHLTNPDDQTVTDTLTISSLLPTSLSQFYRYRGSLTTPPCSEAVVWTLFRNTIPISSSQMQEFRNLLSNEIGSASSDSDEVGVNLPMVDNFRPIQNLNGRPVLSNF